MKNLFLMLGMTAGIGLAICGGALLSMGNAASVPASASDVSTYASTPSWENGEMIDGAIWKLVLCTTPDPSDETMTTQGQASISIVAQNASSGMTIPWARVFPRRRCTVQTRRIVAPAAVCTIIP